MRTLDSQIAEAVRLSVQRVLPPLPETARAVCRIDRRMPDIRRGGRGAGGTRDDAIDFNLYGLTTFLNSSNYTITPTGGGEVGNATGFGAAALVRINALTTGNQGLVCRQNTSQGYALYIDANNRLTAIVYSAAGATITAPIRQLLPSDVGRVFLMMLQSTGSTIRCWCDRAITGAGVAISGYTAPTANQTTALGTINNAVVNAAQGTTILSAMAYTGSPSDSQLQAYYDAARVLGDLPDAMGGATVTHLWSVKRELAGTVVVNGQTAPAQLTDRVTASVTDALARVGSPTVRIIDPTIDGRRTLGAQGFSAANYLQTTGGIRGNASGFWGCALVRFDLASSTEDILGTLNVTATAGWALSRGTTNLTLNVVNGSAANVAAPVGSVSALAGVLTPCVFVSTGIALRLYIGSPVQTGVDQAITGYTTSASAMFIGNRAGNSLGAAGSSVFGVSGGDGYVPTLAEVTQLFADFAANGRVPTVAGKTTHAWDMTLDILASGVDTVPATVLDRVGTDNLTKVGGLSIATNGTWKGLKNWDLATYFTNPSIPLGSTNGFNFLAALQVDSQTVTTNTARMIIDAFLLTPNRGFQLFVGGQNQTITLRSFLSGGTLVDAPVFTITAGMVGTVLLVHGFWDPVSQLLELYVNGTRVGTGTAMATINSGTGAFWVGGHPGIGIPPDGVTIFGVSYGSLPLTAGEISANVTACNAASDVVAVSGKTARLWSFKQDLAGTGGALAALSTDRVGTDALARIGSPLTLAQRTERVWSYEASPIGHGIDAFTDSDHYASVAGQGFVGGTAGWWFALPFVLETQGVASGTRIVAGNEVSGSFGFDIRTTGTNSLISAVAYNSTPGQVSTPSISLASSDVGKQLLFFVVFDGAKVHSYMRRVEAGTGTACTGYSVPDATSVMRIGKHPNLSTFSATGINALGGMGGLSVPTLAEIQAAHDAFLANDDLIAIPGKTDFFVSVKQDARANGGVIPSTLADRIGGKNLSKTGSPALVPMYARAAGW